VCQTLCFQKRFFDKDSKETLKNKFFNYAGVSNILAQVSGLQVSHILPIINCIGSKEPEEQNLNSQLNQKKIFGPLTLEEVRMLFCRHYSL